MPSSASKQKIARFEFQGPDKKGIIAAITGFFFHNQCNILDIDQRILEDYLVMTTVVDHSDKKSEWKKLLEDLRVVVEDKLGMTYKVTDLQQSRPKNIALLVTSEAHCAEKLIADVKGSKIKGEIKVMVGNQPGLEALAKKNKIPFSHFPSENKREHERKTLELLGKHEVDLVVLARYMQILSPEFVFRYEGRIINIHPSLLPAFPGPRSYHQAYNKGVDIVGVTAHFVTTQLDEGPPIAQDAFRVNRVKDDVDAYIRKGRALEAKVLAKAVKLFCDDQLSLRRGKVIIGKKESRMYQITKGFYLG